MELKIGKNKKGMLFTLLTLILFILMLGELFTYVSLNINHNKLVSQLSQSSLSSTTGPSLKSSINAFLHKSMLNALSIIYNPTNMAKEQSITNSNNTANEISQLIITNKLYGVDYSSNMGTTFKNYINALENQMLSQQESVHIINGSLHILQDNPLSVTATYTALVLINNSFVNSTYLIKINIPIATIPSANQSYANIIPPKLVKYIPITLTNSQTIATPSPFQQMIKVNSSTYKQYENTNLQNIEFFYSNGTIITSWLESGNTNISTSTIYWLKINNGIPTQSTITVYMGFANITTNLLNNPTTGEAPQLSSTYGQYDNGASVFNFYDNFAGTTLPSGWTATNTIGYILNDGISITSGSVYTNLAIFPSLNNILEGDVAITSATALNFAGLSQSNTNAPTSGNTGSTAEILYLTNTTTSINYVVYSSDGTSASYNLQNDLALFTPTVNQYYIISSYVSPTTIGEMSNYNILATATGTFNTNQYIVLGYFMGATAGTISITPMSLHYVRTRAYPPNGVMPIAVAGSVN